MENIIVSIKIENINMQMDTIFAKNNLNLVTGLVRVIFIVFLENSPEKLSIVTRATNSGSRVLTIMDRIRKGNSLLETP